MSIPESEWNTLEAYKSYCPIELRLHGLNSLWDSFIIKSTGWPGQSLPGSKDKAPHSIEPLPLPGRFQELIQGSCVVAKSSLETLLTFLFNHCSVLLFKVMLFFPLFIMNAGESHCYKFGEHRKETYPLSFGRYISLESSPSPNICFLYFFFLLNILATILEIKFCILLLFFFTQQNEIFPSLITQL